MEVIDNHNREILGEGRTQGIGFAFGQVTPNKDKFETVMPITSCKDYLNDVVHLEKWPDAQEEEVYGFEYSRNGIFENDNPQMVITVLDTISNNWDDFKTTYRTMVKNIDKMLRFVHSIERKLGFDLTKMTKCKGKYVVEMDPRWVSGARMTSCYTLLWRLQLHYKGRGIIRDFNDVPKNVIPPHRRKVFVNNMDYLLKYKTLPEYDNTQGLYDVHNEGFLSTKFVKND